MPAESQLRINILDQSTAVGVHGEVGAAMCLLLNLLILFVAPEVYLSIVLMKRMQARFHLFNVVQQAAYLLGSSHTFWHALSQFYTLGTFKELDDFWLFLQALGYSGAETLYNLKVIFECVWKC